MNSISIDDHIRLFLTHIYIHIYIYIYELGPSSPSLPPPPSFPGQLNHRVLPRIIHKVTNGNSLTDYHDEGNRIYVGFILVQWLMGLTGNCSIRAFHALAVLQELCEFETGECQLINVNSFGSHQGYSGENTTEWTILDANGTVESGKCSINECLSYTCPSASKRKHD